MSKNIYILPTDKFQNIKLSLFENKLYLGDIASTALPQHIYITSDEEIKEGDWWLNLKTNDADKCTHKSEVLLYNSEKYEHIKKIILTTDQDLIKDGVQAIPDDFLEWFVKNPNCGRVEVENVYDKFLNGDKRSVSDFRKKYKINIPKEDLSYTTKSGINISDEFVRTFMIPKEYFGKEEPKQDWYCPKCDSYVSAESVTFEETHQICNTSVIDKEEPKQETLEEITEQIQKDCHKFVDSIISKVTYQDATNTFLFMKLAELTLKLKKYE